jgi:hypothetical protein
MEKGPIVGMVSLTLAASLALAPIASADRFHGGRVIVSRPVVVSRPFVTHSHSFIHRPFLTHSHSFIHRPFFRPFVPFGVVTSPVVVYPSWPQYYAAPTYDSPYYDSPAYSYPPAVYDLPTRGTVAVAPAPAPPPTPSVVQYPHGRYELRGDGITTPYTWVWIPNPPPPPPPAAPPEGAPAAPPTSSDASPARHSQLYRWLDEEGVAHWTDRWDIIPEQHRAQAKKTPPS